MWLHFCHPNTIESLLWSTSSNRRPFVVLASASRVTKIKSPQRGFFKTSQSFFILLPVEFRGFTALQIQHSLPVRPLQKKTTRIVNFFNKHSKYVSEKFCCSPRFTEAFLCPPSPSFFDKNGPPVLKDAMNDSNSFTPTTLSFEVAILSALAQSWRTYPLQLNWTSSTSRQKIICQQTRRVTTIPTSPLESSRQGEFRSAGSIFLWSIFHLFFQSNFQNNAQTKIDPEDLDSPCRILICRGLRPFRGASVCWQIIF